MKKYFLICFWFFSIHVFGQEADEVGLISKFGAAGGVNPVWVFPNVEALNKILPLSGFGKFSDNGMFGIGGSGYAYVMFIENFRIGGIGLSASQRVKSKVGNYSLEADYSQSFGGVTLEYTIPSIKKIAVSIGAIIGGGGIEVGLYKNSGSFSWNDTFDEYSGNLQSDNLAHRLNLSYFSLCPTLNIDVPINRFIALRLGTGYNFSFGGSWKIDNEKKLSGVPSELNGNSLFFQTGIYFGFFAF